MIVVTGLRSGTSLMMQTLKLLGYPIAGYMFHDDFPYRELNPKGYWDLPCRETLNGLNTDRYKGKAVKLGGYQLSKTSPIYIRGVIHCRRNPKDTIKSIIKLLTLEHDRLLIEPDKLNAEIVNYTNLKHISDYLSITNLPSIEVYYEEMILLPEDTVEKVRKFIGINSDINEAVLNIDKKELSCLQQP